jgi:hypothetical protein
LAREKKSAIEPKPEPELLLDTEAPPPLRA